MQSPDFFAFEARLLERLKGLLADEPNLKWFTSDDNSEIEKRAQFAPAVHIVYGGHRPAGQSKGRNQVIEQTWIVIRSVKSAAGGQDRRDQAGPALGKIVSAVLGWPRARHDEQYSPCQLAPAGGVFYVGAVAHYPVAFTTQMPVEGID